MLNQPSPIDSLIPHSLMLSFSGEEARMRKNKREGEKEEKEKKKKKIKDETKLQHLKEKIISSPFLGELKKSPFHSP